MKGTVGKEEKMSIVRGSQRMATLGQNNDGVRGVPRKQQRRIVRILNSCDRSCREAEISLL